MTTQRGSGVASIFADPLKSMETGFSRLMGRLAEAGGVGEYGFPVDVHEEGEMLVVEAELPGFRRDEIRVSVQSGRLEIVAERTAPQHTGARHVAERRHRRLERSFMLPALVDDSRADARLVDGILRISIPKVAEAPERQIPVQ